MNKQIKVKLQRRLRFYDDDETRSCAFCISGVEKTFPATLDASTVLLEISKTPFKGSKRFLFNHGVLTTRTEHHEVLAKTTNWLHDRDIAYDTYVYIKFSPA